MSTVIVNSIEPRGGLLGISGGLIGLTASTVTIANNLTVSGLVTFEAGSLTVSGPSTLNVLNAGGQLSVSAAAGQQITTGLIVSQRTNPAQTHLIRKDWVDNLAIGIGQTWAAFTVVSPASGSKDATTQRWANASFTNNTGRPIMVAITGTSVAAPSFILNGTYISSYISTNRAHPFSFIVPPLATYGYWTTNASATDPVWWAELR